MEKESEADVMIWVIVAVGLLLLVGGGVAFFAFMGHESVVESTTVPTAPPMPMVVPGGEAERAAPGAGRGVEPAQQNPQPPVREEAAPQLEAPKKK
jgi:flagellar basal body-associated protein FliL